MGFLILLYPFVEIYLFYQFIQTFSFLDAFFWVLLSGVIGLLVIRLQGQATLIGLQKDLAQGRLPASQILHRALVIVGGIFLMIPGFLSDLIGLLLIVPGPRHLVALYLKYLVAKGLFRGRVFMGGFAQGPRPGRPQGFPPPPFEREVRVERDAEVVDVTPLEVTHTKKQDS
jgi:UPF0716 protein FxsA